MSTRQLNQHMARSENAWKLNTAILRAFGFNPKRVRAFRLELTEQLGPIISVELLVDSLGESVLDDGELATVSKEYVLVERGNHTPLFGAEARPLQPKGSTGEIHMEGAD